jgi:cytochrome c551/c552
MEHSGLALPVSGSHLLLLDFLLLVALTVLLVFMTYLSGALMISSSKKSKYEKTGELRWYKMARDYVSHVADYPVIWFACGVVPYIAVILSFLQLMTGQADNQVVFLLTVGFVVYVASLAMAWVYKESVKTGWTQLSLKPEQYTDDNSKAKVHDSTLLSGNYGGWAVFFILVSMWITIAGVVLAYHPEWWGGSILVPLFSWATQIKFSMLTIGGTGLAALGFLYLRYNANDPEELGDIGYQAFAKYESGKLALWFTIMTPVLIGLSMATMPIASASNWVYLLAALAFVLLVIGGHYSYALLKTGESRYAIGGYWLILLVFVFVASSEHQAFSEVNQINITTLAHEYELMEAELIAERSDIPVVAIDGELVFNQKCSSCHRFDKKLVGPAYNNVVPKYYEDQTALIKFILNPYPVNPAEYPGGMANPGLNPDEANAVVEYLTSSVKENLGDAPSTPEAPEDADDAVVDAEQNPVEGDETPLENDDETVQEILNEQ